MTVVSMIISPIEPTPETINWAKKATEEYETDDKEKN
jgi:hypothetical protein